MLTDNAMDDEKKWQQVKEFLLRKASGDILEWSTQLAASEEFEISYRRVEQIALDTGLLPSRYRRNRNTISIAQQMLLFKSTVAIVGCGGIGGNVVEQLARLGVGNLILIDPDAVEDHNVNRQILSSLDVVGEAKVELAAHRVRLVNPAVEVRIYQEPFATEEADSATTAEILHGADVVIDGLDNIDVKRELARECDRLDIPMIYGSVAGWYGQVATQFPGENTVDRICHRCSASRGVETETGNVSFGPAIIASIQVAEACKIITGQGELLRNRMFFIDLLRMDIEVVPV